MGIYVKFWHFLRCPLSKYGYVTWPKKQISKKIYFFLILDLIFDKAARFLAEKLSTSEVIGQKPHGGLVENTPPSAFRVKDNYDWSGLEFPVSIKDIWKVETRNNISVDVLAVEGRDIYIHRKGWRMDREINLLMVSEGGINHYTAIKSLSRLLKSSNTKHKCKQHFCMNCLQSFMQESSRDQHHASLLRGQRVS